jgi:cytochrome c oxidase subunit 2
MSWLFIIILALFVFVVIVQVAKTLEYVSVIRGKEKTDRDANKLNATLLIVFLLAGLAAIYCCNKALRPRLLPRAASDQGVTIDHMKWVTLIITGIVFLATQIMLFVFAFVFRSRPGHSAQYISPYSTTNTRLEIVWTSVTLVVLLILVVVGLRHWFKMTGAAPPNAMIVEVTGRQFEWIFRYPGPDGELGKKNYKLVNDRASNPLGQNWSDRANRDDIVATTTLHLVVNKPVRLVINSQDVIHDVGLPYFRLKMDAVPGVPTSLWFTPTITTDSMKRITGNPDFVYELACDQLCGNAHYAMRATVVVETRTQFDQWISRQKSQYAIAMASEAGTLKGATADAGTIRADTASSGSYEKQNN